MWAEAAAELMRHPEASRAAALTALGQSPMDMRRARDAMVELHA